MVLQDEVAELHKKVGPFQAAIHFYVSTYPLDEAENMAYTVVCKAMAKGINESRAEVQLLKLSMAVLRAWYSRLEEPDWGPRHPPLTVLDHNLGR